MVGCGNLHSYTDDASYSERRGLPSHRGAPRPPQRNSLSNCHPDLSAVRAIRRAGAAVPQIADHCGWVAAEMERERHFAAGVAHYWGPVASAGAPAHCENLPRRCRWALVAWRSTCVIPLVGERDRNQSQKTSAMPRAVAASWLISKACEGYSRILPSVGTSGGHRHRCCLWQLLRHDKKKKKQRRLALLRPVTSAITISGFRIPTSPELPLQLPPSCLRNPTHSMLVECQQSALRTAGAASDRSE